MIWLWIGFILFILAILALDLGILSREHRVMSARTALKWVAVFVSLGAIFNVLIYFMYANNWLGVGAHLADIMKAGGEPVREWGTPKALGWTAAMQFLAGWLTEYSLSIDNLFVIALVFQFFKVKPEEQHRVLFWGILGALIARGIMILAGTAAVQQFEWILYILGAFLIYTGFKMAFHVEDESRDFDKMFVVRLARKIIPISKDFDGQHFFTRLPSGKHAATPLFLALLIVEVTDVIFAVDSIPAIIGITRDPFIVFTSNVFAILGLRSLYFALRAMMDKFHHLKYSLAAVLAFVGFKMLLEGAHHLRPLAARLFGDVPGWLSWLPTKHIHVPTAVSLGVIVVTLALGVVASLIYAKKHPHPPTILPREGPHAG